MMGCERHGKEIGRLWQNVDPLRNQAGGSRMRSWVASLIRCTPKNLLGLRSQNYIMVTPTMSYNTFIDGHVGAIAMHSGKSACQYCPQSAHGATICERQMHKVRLSEAHGDSAENYVSILSIQHEP